MKARSYSHYEDAAIIINARRLTSEEIGVLIGRTKFSVRKRAERLGVSINKNPPYTLDDDEIIEKYSKTKSSDEIGKILGRTGAAIRKRAFDVGITLIKHGQYHHRAVHSNEDMDLVRLLIVDGSFHVKRFQKK